MAQRRFANAMAGLGAGITNAGDILLRTMMQDRLQSRIDERAAKNAEAIANRQTEAATTADVQKILDELAQGGDPESAAARISIRTGRKIDPQALESLRPSPRRRMEKNVGEDITKANTPEQVPDDATIAGIAKTQGLALPEFAYAGMEPTSQAGTPTDPNYRDPYEYAGGIAREFGDRAAARRKSLDVPELVDFTDPLTNAKGKKAVSRRDPAMRAGVVLGPDAEQQAGFDAMAEGAKAKARQDVELAPDAINARVGEAGRKSGAEARAKLQAELNAMGMTAQQQSGALQLADDYTKQSSVFTATKQAVSSISTLAQRIEAARKQGQDSPAAHIGLIFNFMKMQDPGSTVREGEQAMAANAAGVDERIRNLYNSVLKGGRLSPEQVSDFVQTAADVYSQRAQAQKALEGDFAQRAAALHVPAPLVTGFVSALANGPQTAKDKLHERGGGQ